MPGIENTVLNFINAVIPIAWILTAVALVINGIMMAVGGQEGREKAKKALPWVAIDSFLVVGAVTIAQWIVSNIAF